MGTSTAPAPADGIGTAVAPPLEINTLSQFRAWVAEQKLFLATTCQLGKLFFLGTNSNGELSPSNTASSAAWACELAPTYSP